MSKVYYTCRVKSVSVYLAGLVIAALQATTSYKLYLMQLLIYAGMLVKGDLIFLHARPSILGDEIAIFTAVIH